MIDTALLALIAILLGVLVSQVATAVRFMHGIAGQLVAVQQAIGATFEAIQRMDAGLREWTPLLQTELGYREQRRHERRDTNQPRDLIPPVHRVYAGDAPHYGSEFRAVQTELRAIQDTLKDIRLRAG